MNDEYKGYELNDTVYSYMLSEKEIDILERAIWIVDNRVSIRQCSKEMGASKSTIHRQIHNELRQLSYELYKCVCRQLIINKKKYFKIIWPLC